MADGYHSKFYRDYLKSESWQQKRLGYFKRHGYFCRGCGVTKNLQLHHDTYEHLGDEPDEDLWCLDDHCHRMAHRYFASGKYATLKAATWQAVKDARAHRKAAIRRRKKLKKFVARIRRVGRS